MKQPNSLRPSAILLAIAAGFGQSLAFAAPVPPADVIYTGGNIVTVNELQPRAEAIAVQGGRIVAVGYRDEVMKLQVAKTRIVDLGSKTLVPGFVDPHGHVFNAGIQAISANLLPRPDGEVNDIAEIQATLKAWSGQNQKITGKYGWIVGFGYDDAQLKEQRHPTRDDLDKVSSDLPVVIVHQSAHLAVMNSKALELGPVNTKRNPSTISAKLMNAMNMTSSFSNREKMRRNPFRRRNSRSISLRRVYRARSYSHGATRLGWGGTTGMYPRSTASCRVSSPSYARSISR